MKRKHVVEFEKDGKILRVALYIRVSTEEQVRHGLSLEAQKEALVRYAKENGWKIVDIYADEGTTARKKLTKRKEFQRLLQDIQDDLIDVVIFIKLDRWFRNVADYYKTQEILDAHHVDWIATEEDYDTKTANGRLHLNIKLSIAQNESDQTSDRINFVFANKRKNGQVTSGTKKFGFDIVDKKYVVNEEEKAISIDCANYFVSTGSIRATTDYYNSKYSPIISTDTMRKRLGDTANIGIWKRYGRDEVIEAYKERLWDDELWDKVQKILEKNIHISKTTDGVPYEALFDGLVYCKDCGNRFTRDIQKNKDGTVNRVYYRCWKQKNTDKYGNHLCTNKSMINQKTLEKYVLDNFKKEAEKYIIENTIVDEAKEEKPKKDNSAMIKKKMDKLADLYLLDKIDKDYYMKEYDRLNAEYKKEAQPKKPKPKKKDLTKVKKLLEQDFEGLYTSLNDEEKRKFLMNTIEKIIIRRTEAYEGGKVEKITFL